MAKPLVKQAGDSASDADWQIANQREGALKMPLEASSPVAVAEVAADLRLNSAMVYRLLAVYRRDPSTSSLLPNRGGRVSGTRLLSIDVETVIQTLISGYYLKRQRPHRQAPQLPAHRVRRRSTLRTFTPVWLQTLGNARR